MQPTLVQISRTSTSRKWNERKENERVNASLLFVQRCLMGRSRLRWFHCMKWPLDCRWWFVIVMRRMLRHKISWKGWENFFMIAGLSLLGPQEWYPAGHYVWLLPVTEITPRSKVLLKKPIMRLAGRETGRLTWTKMVIAQLFVNEIPLPVTILCYMNPVDIETLRFFN